MNNWSKKWNKIFLWATGYLSIVAFAVVGGYALVKGDEDSKKTAKSVLIATLIFAGISAILTIISTVGGLFDGYYSSAFYDFYRVLNAVTVVAKIAVYALNIIFELFKKEEKSIEKVETVDEE